MGCPSNHSLPGNRTQQAHCSCHSQEAAQNGRAGSALQTPVSLLAYRSVSDVHLLSRGAGRTATKPHVPVFFSNRSQDEHLFHLFFSAPASPHYSIFSRYLISSLSRSPKLVHAALRNFYSIINQPPYILSLFAISLPLLQPSPASTIPLKFSQEMHIPQGQRTCRLIRFAVPWYHFKALFKIPVLRRTSSSILSSWLKT